MNNKNKKSNGGMIEKEKRDPNKPISEDEIIELFGKLEKKDPKNF
jgi:hypothetical protein